MNFNLQAYHFPPLSTPRKSQLYAKVVAEKQWIRRYKELKAYKKEHGNTDVKRTHSNGQLANWVWVQRARKRNANKRKNLTETQIELLNKLNFSWNPLDERWKRKFYKLKTLLAEPDKYYIKIAELNDRKFQIWINDQWAAFSKGEMSGGRKALLASIGFDLECGLKTHDLKWNEIYHRLNLFHDNYGHANVPKNWNADLKLANWVSAQRCCQSKGKLSEARIQLLDDLGFIWNRHNARWEERFAEVLAFKAIHGHFKIPFGYPNSPKLRRFMDAMRNKRNSGNLSKARIAKLELIGFPWREAR